MARDKSWLRCGVVAVCAWSFTSLVSCGGQNTPDRCTYENWSGTCQLQNAFRTRLIETMPAISVVEAVYEPQKSGAGPTLLPPTQSQEFRVRAEHERQLIDHLQNNRAVECRFQKPSGGSCSAGGLVLSIPAFAPPPVVVADADAGVAAGGCAELERGGRMSEQGASAQLPAGVPVELLFEANSADASPELEQQVARVAEALQANPEIECLAVVGQVTAGEQRILGDERAATVKNLLVSRGIQSNRLQTIAAVVPLTGEAARAVIPEDRKVRLRVLLRRAGAQQPAP